MDILRSRHKMATKRWAREAVGITEEEVQTAKRMLVGDVALDVDLLAKKGNYLEIKVRTREKHPFKEELKKMLDRYVNISTIEEDLQNHWRNWEGIYKILHHAFNLEVEMYASPLNFTGVPKDFCSKFEEDVWFGSIGSAYQEKNWTKNAVWNPEYTNEDMKKAIRNAVKGAKRSKKVRHFLTLPIWEDKPKKKNKKRQSKKEQSFDYMNDLRLLEAPGSDIQAVQLIEFDAREYSFIAPTSTVTGKRKITPAKWKMGIWMIGFEIQRDNKLSQVKQDLDEWRMTNGSKFGHWSCQSKTEEVWCEGCNNLSFSITNSLGKCCPKCF